MRKRKFAADFIIFTVVLLMIVPCQGQTDFSLSGYLLDFPIYQHTSGSGAEKDFFTNVLRLRLRPTLFLSGSSHIRLEYEASSLYRSTGFTLIQQTYNSVKQLVDLTWNPVGSGLWTVHHSIDRLFYRHDFNFAEFTVGRQRIAWGTGRVWNPTDLFNPINPTSFAKVEKDGVDAVLTKLTLGSFSDLSLVYNPTDVWRNNNYGFRIRTNFSEYDISAMGGRFDHRWVVGGDFAGNFFNAGIRGEGIVSADVGNGSDTFTKYILGIDYQFSAEFYCLLEYHFNGEGAEIKEKYDLDRLFGGSIMNLGRHYVIMQGSYLIHPLLSASAGWTINTDDRSNYINMILSYSASDEVLLSVGGQAFFGEQSSEYRYYPGGIYAKGDIYFGN